LKKLKQFPELYFTDTYVHSCYKFEVMTGLYYKDKLVFQNYLWRVQLRVMVYCPII